MKTTTIRMPGKVLTVLCLVLMSIAGYSQTVLVTVKNMVQTSPSEFQYEVWLTNTSAEVLSLRGYSWGMNTAIGLNQSGYLTNSFVSRDASLSSIPSVSAGITGSPAFPNAASAAHLRGTTTNATSGNEVPIAVGGTVRLATMRVNKVTTAGGSVASPWTGNNINPFINLGGTLGPVQVVTAAGKTQCVATIIPSSTGVSVAINGTANSAAAGTVQGLTGTMIPTPTGAAPFLINAAATCVPVITNVSATACDSYTWALNNQTYTTSGINTYFAAQAGNPGCFDTTYLNLTINNSTTSSTTATACDSYTWSANGTTYTASGTYTATSLNAAGCMHTETLDLTINASTSSSSIATACDSYTWNSTAYTASGTYTATSLNAAGCTHTETLNLTINSSTSSSSSITACDSYTWNGSTYTASGTYTATSLNAAACTHTETLNLTINSSTSSSSSITACDSYTWNGSTYTASGTYTATSLNAAGCTHTETLSLTINASTSSSLSASACDSYLWATDGVSYTATGTYTYTSLNAAGCTNTDTLNLTVNQSSTSSDTQSVCDSYTWSANGVTYTASGTYTYTSLNAGGCLNTATLNLTITPSSNNTTVIAANNSYTWSVTGQTYTTSGIKTGTTTNCVTELLDLTITQTLFTGPSTAVGPYVLPVASGVTTTSMLTVPETVGGYKMVGLPDGLGAFDNNNGTFTLLMNHELGSTLGAVRTHGAKGSFVSKWIINKSDLSIISGSDLMTSVYGWNSTTQSQNSTSSTIAFQRFCSADLSPVSAYYNPYSGLGTQDRIFMHGEEGGATGYQVATIASGTDAGKAYILGKFNLSTNGSGLTGVGAWENALANPFAQDKTIVIGNNDGGTGIMNNSVCVYQGTKTNSGTAVDKAGLTNGTLKFVNVAGNPLEIPTANVTTRATNITSGTAFTLSATSSTTFSRPEDGAWDPTDNSKYYFVTTDRLDQVADGVGTQIGRSRLWRLNFTDITNPDSGGTIDLLLDGTEGQNMMDNMTFDKFGHILLQEDPGGAPHNAKIWQYTIATDQIKLLAKHDPAKFGDIVSGVAQAATLPFNNDEESSGIIDMSDILGAGNFLFADQAHYLLSDPEAVEGGQLLKLYNPDTYTAAQCATASSDSQSVCDSYTWSANGVTYTASGTYTYTSLNAGGCLNTATLNLTINHSTSTTTTATATGSYTWSVNGQTYFASGTYTATSLNAAGCTHTETLILTISGTSCAYTLSVIEDQPISCNGNTDASVLATATPAGSYTYTIVSPGATTSTNTTGYFDHLVPGTHTVYATDGSCISSQTIYLMEPAPLAITFTTDSLVSCFGNDGQLSVNITGGTNVLQGYLTWWTNAAGDTLNDVLTNNFALALSNLPAGPYNVAVEDDHGCFFNATGNIGVAAPISVTANYAPIVCQNGTTSINPATTGGVPYTAYTYTVNGLTLANPYPAGTYTVVATDAKGCTGSSVITISNPAAITGATSVTACNSYTWAGTTYTASGTYVQTFTAANGCDSVHTLVLNLNNGVKVSPKALLSGAYVSAGMMRDDLRANGVLPTTEPYTALSGKFPPIGCPGYNGGETTTPAMLAVTGNDAIVDWVHVEIRNTDAAYSKVATQNALIQRDGDIVDVNGNPLTFNCVCPGNYYVVVKHRNHLGVMTASSLPLTSTTTSVDFTTAAPVWTKPGIIKAARETNGAYRLLWPGDTRTDKNTKYNGLNNDKEPIIYAVGIANPNNILFPVYRTEDANMNAEVKYNNTNNDKNFILDKIGVTNPNDVLLQHTPN